MSVRRLEVEGADAFTGAGIYYGAALSEASSARDSDVVVVGGANSAGQAALLLSSYARTVRMVVRGPTLVTSMSQYLIDRIEAQENLEVLTDSKVVGVSGGRTLEAVTVRMGPDEATRRLSASHMFIFIGSMPRSDIVSGVVELNEHGFVLTGPDLLREGKRPRGWPLARNPSCSRRARPGSSRSVTCGRVPPSAWRPPWGKGRQRLG